MRKVQRDHGYVEVRTPQVVDRILWERSGHWSNYAENMFTTSSESRDYAVKPMNCPCHVQIFNQGLKSYRDLPLRRSPSSAPATTTSRPARCTGSCVYAALPRTTRISSAPKSR